MKIGQFIRPTVHIFATGDDVEPVSVDIQEQFQSNWHERHAPQRP